MEKIAFTLTDIVRGFKIPALVGYIPGRGYVYRTTPSSILYPIKMQPGQRLSLLLGVTSDIERELNERLGRTDLRLFVQKSPAAIEVLKSTVEKIYLNKQTLDRIPSNTAVIGETYTIMSTNILGIDLSSPGTSHVLISGMTGSGKSSVTKTLIGSLCYTSSPHDLRLFAIDMKNRGLGFLRGVPHLEGGVSIETETALNTVDSVSQLLQDRRADGTSSPRVVLVIDELAEFVDGELARVLFSTLPTIARQGRELGIHIVATIHRPTVSSFGGDFLQSFGAKITGRLRNAREASLILNVPDSGADRLPGSGSMLYSRASTGTARFQSYLSDSIDELIAAKWGSLTSLPPTPSLLSATISRVPEEIMSVPTVPTEKKRGRKTQLQSDLEALRPVIHEFVSFEGEKHIVRRGGWTKMAEALGTYPGGAVTKRITDAIHACRKETECEE